MSGRRRSLQVSSVVLALAACGGGAGQAPLADIDAAVAADARSRPLDAHVARDGASLALDSATPDSAPDVASDTARPDAAAEDSAPAATIVVENLAPGEVVPHDLLVLQGTVSAPVTDLRVELGGRTSTWPVVGGQFRALALLAQGENQVTLAAGASSARLRVVYTPPTNPRFIRFVYIVAADGDGNFEGAPGEPHDQANALARLRVDARLMQTFTAETMRRAGFGRRTFRLARDAAHEPIVEVWKSKLSTAQARAMDGNALWSAFYAELGALPNRDATLDVAVMSMTHYVPATKTTQAHTALGGGRLGLFGSGTLYAHPASLEEVAARFGDARVVDESQLRDDSASRRTWWSNFATGIGAMEHEMGHCLSLPHPANHQGFMYRAFDHFNRTFVIAEPRSEATAALAPVRPEHEAGIDRSNAVRLRFHRWLAPTDRTYVVERPPTITVDAASLRLASPAGIRHVQYLVAGDGADHDEHLADPPPPTLTIPLGPLRARLGGAKSVNVSTIDDDGNIASRDDVALP